MSQAKILGPNEGKLFSRANDMRVKVSSEDTGGNYEICYETCPPGFQSRRHMHTKDWETFIITEGSATWTVGDETVEAVKGTTIHIPPETPHKVTTENGCEMVCVFSPGQQSKQFEEMAQLTDEQKNDKDFMKSFLSKFNLVPLE